MEYYDGSAAGQLDRQRLRFESLHYRKVAGILEAVESLAIEAGSMNVCEVGVGSALHASWFMEKISAARFFGVDISVGSLESGRRRWERFEEFIPVQGSAYTLPFESGVFDLVYFSGSLHHCQQPGRAVGEAARILRKGGILVISEPVWYYPANLYYNLRIPEEAGQRLLRRSKVRGWCVDGGLTPQSFSYFNYLPRPARLEGFFLGLEKILSSIPIFGRLSSMFRCVARK
jgi:SAM-dependent methyltransferase